MACVVYGGSRGIGKAIASAFLQDGYSVAIVARNIRQLEDTAHELQGIIEKKKSDKIKQSLA